MKLHLFYTYTHMQRVPGCVWVCEGEGEHMLTALKINVQIVYYVVESAFCFCSSSKSIH